MKKVSKLMVLLLVAVFVLGVFSGCGVIGKNSQKYRATVAMTIGNESITIGKLLDTYNNYYNQYSGYISAGYFTASDVFDAAIGALYTQYMKVDAYKSMDGTVVSAKGDFANQEYLTAEELDYAISYVKYVLFTTLDTLVESYVKVDYDLGDKKDEDDTSRDFAEFDDLKGFATYSDYTYAQSFSNEEMDEYVSKYYQGILTGSNISVDEYVYATDDAAAAMVADLNERIEGDSKITAAQYREWQQQALKQYKKNVLSAYKYDISDLVKRQVEDFIISAIVAKYNYTVYSKIDNAAGLPDTIAKLKADYAEALASQLAGFNINENFVSFIESLTDTSYIYDVPTQYQYIYVKNILVPFTDAQKTILTNLSSQLGSSDETIYLQKRAEFAAQVIAENFTEKDENGENVKDSDLFKLDTNGKVIINPTGKLASVFAADGTVVAAEGKTLDETVMDLMKTYNTDTAQHSTIYDYVVRVGNVPDSYSAKWVSEFVDAANEAFDIANGANGGTYSIAISTYGVHIVYYSAKVTAQTFDYDNDLLKTNSVAYRTFKSYYETQSKKLLEEALDGLRDSYYADKISITKEFNKFLKNNKLEFDFEDSLVHEH